ncbi:FCD domain-containing protein [Jeotgalibacillus marinus]|uniref:FCD domain-containing protein n=1 Tax=Jeotgalibacillus marinus TaxID=86667 RepID=A0ABV3Q8W9_9BACL
MDEHQEIYDAIKQRDADKAEKLMPEHLQADLDFSIHVL